MSEEFEYQTHTLGISANISEELAKLEAEGWEIVPGAAPVAVYHLRRVKNRLAHVGGRGGITIDESKVYILRADGSKVFADGTVERKASDG
jgi:hypothetical protein